MFRIWNINGESRGLVHPIKRADRAGEVEMEPYEEPVKMRDPYRRAQQKRSTRRRRAMTAEEIMSAPVKTLGPDISLKAAWAFLCKWRFRHVPILDQRERLIGILSDRDVLRAVDDLDEPGTWAKEHRRISDVMSTDIISSFPDTSIRRVAQLMFEKKIGSMPIVSESGNLMGLITRSDILRTLIKDAPLEIWL